MSPKVFHLIDTLEPGGAQTVLKGILEHPPHRDRMRAVALRRVPIEKPIEHEALEIFPSESRWSLGPLRSIRKTLQQEPVDVLHCHLLRSQVFGWCLKRFWFPKLKLVFHEHSEIFEPGKVFPLFLRLAAKDVDLFLGVSQASCDLLAERSGIPPSKLKTLYNFVDLQVYAPETKENRRAPLRERLGISGEAFVLGFGGRLVGLKGWRCLLDAVDQLADLSAFHLVIAGEGPDRKAIEARVDPSRVHVLGHVNDLQENFFPMLDALAVPSTQEALNIMQLEAMAMKVPVLISDIPGLNELVRDGENGRLLPSEAPEAWAKAIREMIQQPGPRVQWAESAYEDIQARSLTKYMRRLNAIYESF